MSDNLNEQNKKQRKQINNEIIRNCVDIINAGQVVIKKRNGEMSIGYDVCAKRKNAPGLMKLFTIKHEYNPYLRSNYYALSVTENVTDKEFYSNINYGDGIDFSEAYILYAGCREKYEEQQKTNVLKKFNSMKSYVAYLRAEYVKTEQQ